MQHTIIKILVFVKKLCAYGERSRQKNWIRQGQGPYSGSGQTISLKHLDDLDVIMAVVFTFFFQIVWRIVWR